MYEFLLSFHWIFNYLYSNIGSDNGLVPTCCLIGTKPGHRLLPDGHQAIIWTNDGQITSTYMRHSTSMS